MARPTGQLTVKGAAELLDVSPRRVRQFVQEGRLRAEKIGGMYFIRAGDLSRFSERPRPTGNLTGRPRVPKGGRKRGRKRKT